MAGCGGNSASRNGCGTHHYAYVGGAAAVPAGAVWYGGAGGYSDGSYGYGGGWYDPGDDGSDYGNDGSYGDGSGSSGGGSGSDGTYYDDGSGDGSGWNDGSGSGDGSGYDDGSGSGGDGTGSDGSGSDGSGSDGSGSDGSGDDGTAAKKHLHTANASLHTASSPATRGCYAYTCTLVCVVGSPATQEREARGQSAISSADACTTAAHGIETWAHQTLGQDVSACKEVTANGSGVASTTGGARTPATPSITQNTSSSGAVARSYAGVGTAR